MEPSPNWSEEKDIEYFTKFWTDVYNRFLSQLSLFPKIYNDLILNYAARNLREHPISQIIDYLDALLKTGAELAYSQQQINAWCKHPEMWNGITGHNVFKFYASYYFSNFLIRVKLSTDLLALTLNLIYDLQLQPESCDLESGRFKGLLGELRPKKNSKSWKRIKELINVLENSRQWIVPLKDLRNDSVHRGKLPWMGTYDKNGNTALALHVTTPSDVSIKFPASNPYTGSIFDDDGSPLLPVHALRYLYPLPLPRDAANDNLDFWQQVDNRNPVGSIEDREGFYLAKFLLKINSKSVGNKLDSDPIILCSEIWERLISLIEDVFRLISDDIEEFVNQANQPQGG
jgi:hypothetical protein